MHEWQIMPCGHCGNRTYFHIRAEYARTRDVLDDNNCLTADEAQMTWYILECSSCGDMAFYRAEQLVERHSQLVKAGGGAILYPPVQSSLYNLPGSVQSAYGEAYAVRFTSPRACAVMAGVTLEALCKEERTPGTSLAAKLEHLATSGRIPPVLAQMAQQLRQIRNLGAHADEAEVTKDDVSIILEYVEAILEYVYVAPARVAAVEQRLKQLHREGPAG